MMIDSAGTFFTPATGARDGRFYSNDPLWASGVSVEEGKRYKITMTVNGDGQDEWKDHNISGFSINGFGRERMSPPMYLGLLYRRNLMEPWFKPIARIGKYGTDEYPLNPVAGSASDDKTLIAEIKARKTGELFLYVNDSIVPGPRAWQVFYKNNKGYADVKIEPLD
jgi:hypothetical protein